jgi:hypothetical protein
MQVPVVRPCDGQAVHAGGGLGDAGRHGQCARQACHSRQARRMHAQRGPMPGMRVCVCKLQPARSPQLLHHIKCVSGYVLSPCPCASTLPACMAHQRSMHCSVPCMVHACNVCAKPPHFPGPLPPHQPGIERYCSAPANQKWKSAGAPRNGRPHNCCWQPPSLSWLLPAPTTCTH